MKRYKLLYLIIMSLLVFIGSLSAELTAPTVGTTQVFKVFGQGFFSGYYPITATMQADNADAYFFVENPAINDIAVNPANTDDILLATESGVLKTLDGGLTWTFANGLYDGESGDWDTDDMLPEGYRTGGGDSEPQHRVPVTSIFHLKDGDWMAGCGIGHKQFGDTKTFGGFRSKNSGEKWSFISRGSPVNNVIGPSDENVDERPTFYEMVNEPSDEDYFFAATESGVLFFSKSQWKNWPGAGLPQITTEWEFMPVYDISYNDSDSMMTIATELGLYQGFVDFDEEQIAWKPLGTSTVDILSVSTFIDSATVVYDVVESDTVVITFDVDVTVDDLEDGTYEALVDGVSYTVNEVIVDTNSVSLITNTTTQADSLEITPVAPMVYLNGTDVLSPNQWVTIIDNSNQLSWSGKARFTGGKWHVELNEDNQYFADLTLVDPDTIDYTTYLPLESDLMVMASGTVPYTTIIENGANIYCGSATGIYVYNGTSTALIEGSEGMVVNDLTLNDTDMFVGTTLGIYRMNGSTLTDVSPIMNDGFSGEGHEYPINVKSVYAQNDTIYFGGDLGGFYRSIDAGDHWSAMNTGLTSRQVTLAQVDSLSMQLSPDVFTTLETNFGDFPDVDGLDKMFVLVLDLNDQYYSSQGSGGGTTSEIRVLDQALTGDPVTDLNSNYRDLIYLDSDPGDISTFESAKWAVHQLSKLIMYNADNDEEVWVNEGLSGLATFQAGKIVAADNTYKIASKNSLTIWGDIIPLQDDYDHVFVFMEFIREHYLKTPALIKALVSNEENGIDGLMSVIAQVDADITFPEILKNFILAARFDGFLTPAGEVFGSDSLYNITALDVKLNGAIKDWGFTTGAVGDSPFVFKTTENSVVYYFINGLDEFGNYWAPGMGDKLVFNIDDVSDTQIIILLMGDLDGTVVNQYVASDMRTVSLDSRHFGVFDDFSDFDTPDSAATYHQIGVLLITGETRTALGGSAVFHDMTTPPDFLDLGVDQSAVFNRYIDVYGFSDQPIYDDGGMHPFYNTDDNVSTAELEGPIALITDAAGDTLASATLDHFHIDPDLSIFGYRTGFELPEGDGSYLINLSGESLWGGQISSDQTTVEAAQLIPGIAKVLASSDGSISLHIPASSISEEVFATLISNNMLAGSMEGSSEENDALSSIARIGPYETHLETSALLKMKYENADLDAGEAINIYKLTDDGWEVIPSRINEKDMELQASISEFGYYQIRKGLGENIVDLPRKFALHENYPNPFNPTTTIQYDVAEASSVRLVVYNLLGQQVTTLVNQVQSPGFYSVAWNGTSGSGLEVSSGIYFLRLETVDGQFNQKMIYMK